MKPPPRSTGAWISPAAMLVAGGAEDVASVLKRLRGRAAAWILVLERVDDAARALMRDLESDGHDCLLIHADFHDPSARLQAIAIARDFAGAPTLIWDCGSAWSGLPCRRSA